MPSAPKTHRSLSLTAISREQDPVFGNEWVQYGSYAAVESFVWSSDELNEKAILWCYEAKCWSLCGNSGATLVHSQIDVEELQVHVFLLWLWSPPTPGQKFLDVILTFKLTYKTSITRIRVKQKGSFQTWAPEDVCRTESRLSVAFVFDSPIRPVHDKCFCCFVCESSGGSPAGFSHRLIRTVFTRRLAGETLQKVLRRSHT